MRESRKFERKFSATWMMIPIWENMCSGGNCGGKCLPFGPLLEGTERSREGRKKNEEEEEEEKREKREKSEEEEEDEEDEEDKEMSDLVDEKQVKTRNEKCVCCDKLIKGQKYVFPKREGDVRSGKACCHGCYDKARAEKMNENCVVCQKQITSDIRRHPKIDGDVRSGQPCCRGCYDKAIEKKNLELENLCHRCAAGVDGQKRKRGGRHVTLDPIFSGEFWTCEECKRKARNRKWYIAKLEKQGKPKPRSYKKRKF
jgi:hypothetical protein